MHPLSHPKKLCHATTAWMQSVLAPQCNVTPCPQRILCCEEGVSLHLLLKSTPPWREGLWLPKKGTNQVFDLQKTKPACISRSLYWRRMTCQLWRWVSFFGWTKKNWQKVNVRYVLNSYRSYKIHTHLDCWPRSFLKSKEGNKRLIQSSYIVKKDCFPF